MKPSSSSEWDAAARRHLDNIEKNLAFADWLKSSGRTDPTTVGWAITVLFYASLHAVRAHLARVTTPSSPLTLTCRGS
jgi:hypothetical protein